MSLRELLKKTKHYFLVKFLGRVPKVIFDEVKVKEGLVFNKHSGQIIGFVDIGDINNEIEKLEETINKPPELAKSMLVFMIRELFTDLCYPYAQFSCDGLMVVNYI